MARNRLGEALANALFTYGVGKTPRQIQQEREAANLQAEIDRQRLTQLNLANALTKIQVNNQKAAGVQLGLEIDKTRLQNARQEQMRRSEFYQRPIFDVGIGENLSLEQVEGLPPTVQQYLFRSTPYAQERLRAEQERVEIAKGNLGARQQQAATATRFKAENLKSRDSRELSRLNKERDAKLDQLSTQLRGSDKFSVLTRAFNFFPEDGDIISQLQQGSPEAVAEYLLSKSPEDLEFLLRPYSRLNQAVTDLQDINRRYSEFEARFSQEASQVPEAPAVVETPTIRRRSAVNAERQAQAEQTAQAQAMRPSAALQQLSPDQRDNALEAIRQARQIKSSRGESLTNAEAVSIVKRFLERAGKQSIEAFQETAPEIAQIREMDKGKAKRTIKTLLRESGIAQPGIDAINTVLEGIRSGQIMTLQDMLDNYGQLKSP